ncbi:unnamed protein product, partial [Penicillium discolor]
LRNIGAGDQRENTFGDLPARDVVEGRLLVVTPATPTTPATPQNSQTPTPPNRRLTSSDMFGMSTVMRNGCHGLKGSVEITSAAGVADF